MQKEQFTSLDGKNAIPTDVTGVDSQIKDLDRMIKGSTSERHSQIFHDRKAVLQDQRKKLTGQES